MTLGLLQALRKVKGIAVGRALNEAQHPAVLLPNAGVVILLIGSRAGHHSALGLMTPATVHFGQAERVTDQRQQVLQVAYAAHPERFVRGEPRPPSLPEEVWINRPQPGSSRELAIAP